MRDALDSLELPPEHADTLWRYLTSAAESLRNTPE
jgi:truncated hemoglobin YjbI